MKLTTLEFEFLSRWETINYWCPDELYRALCSKGLIFMGNITPAGRAALEQSKEGK